MRDLIKIFINFKSCIKKEQESLKIHCKMYIVVYKLTTARLTKQEGPIIVKIKIVHHLTSKSEGLPKENQIKMFNNGS